MSLRKAWVETEEWVRMECDTLMLNKHLMLPPDELTVFGNKMIKRFENMLRVCVGHTPINHPDVKLLLWVWLHLHPTQQEYVSSLDGIESVTTMMRVLGCHKAVMDDMLKPESNRNYWHTNDYVQLVHNTTPKSIVTLDLAKRSEILREYYRDPMYARENNLAMQYTGENIDDVLQYVGKQHTLVSHSPTRLILETPAGNAQILPEQWIWFKGGVLKHGNLKTLMTDRVMTVDPHDAPGFWIKPSTTTSTIMSSNLCPEMAA